MREEEGDWEERGTVKRLENGKEKQRLRDRRDEIVS